LRCDFRGGSTVSVVVASAKTNAAVPAPEWVWGPAGRDVQLARAVSDLTTGGYFGTTRKLLAVVRGRGQFDRRAYCSSVLAALIVHRQLPCARQWLLDEPMNPDALLLHARVLIMQAIHAYRAHAASADIMAAWGVKACHDAAYAAQEDPTPWVTLLSLGEVDPNQSELQRSPMEASDRTVRPWRATLDEMAIYGPWWLLGEIVKRDPFNREAFHRLIPCCCSSSLRPATSLSLERAALQPATVDDTTARARVAVWAADQAPDSSPLKLLRLMYSPLRDPFPDSAEQMRLENHVRFNGDDSREMYLKGRIPAIEQRWHVALRAEAVELVTAWFAKDVEPPYMPLSDLSFLADYLHRVGEIRSARRVLDWMIPHATAEPWRRDGAPGRVLAKVCLECGIHPGRLPT
jgi:hypothetical protein